MQSKHNSIYKIKYTNATFRGLIYVIRFDYLRLYLVYRDDLKNAMVDASLRLLKNLFVILRKKYSYFLTNVLNYKLNDKLCFIVTIV